MHQVRASVTVMLTKQRRPTAEYERLDASETSDGYSRKGGLQSPPQAKTLYYQM